MGLDPIFGLGLLDAIFHNVVEGLLTHGFVFPNCRFVRCFRYAGYDHAVHAAGDMGGLWRIRVSCYMRNTGSPYWNRRKRNPLLVKPGEPKVKASSAQEVGHHRFFIVTTLEQPKDPALKPFDDRPSEAQPELPVARMAERRDTHV